ncbi:MAG: repeat-containing protein [Acidobacteria bacterium]|nr:repeat-containing protein [Acidobacteriota bacterium]
MRGFLFAILILTFLPTLSRAQNSGLDPDIGNPGLGGRNTIQGRIYYPSGKPLDRRLRVRVNSVRGGPTTVTSDDNGAFTIYRLTDGNYDLTVDVGGDYQPTSESVQIIGSGLRGSPGQIAYVQITLKLKEAATKPPGVLNAAFAGVPKPALDSYQQAIVAAQKGDHKKAVEHLKKAIAAFPEFMLAFNELGLEYFQLNELDHAAESLRVALKLAPEAFLPRLNYGLVLLQQKKPVEAEAELRLAIAKSDASASAHEYLGRALIGLKKLEEAEKELLRALVLGGEQAANAHRYLAAIYMQVGEDARALAELQEYLRLQPKVKDAEQIKQIIKELSAKK